jgi:hypothetical protein
LLQPLNNPADEAERLAKSIIVQDRGVAYVDSFTAHVGAERATIYMHLAIDHVPDMVRDFDIDISDLSQQFVEHKLKQGKTDIVTLDEIRCSSARRVRKPRLAFQQT